MENEADEQSSTQGWIVMAGWLNVKEQGRTIEMNFTRC